MAPAVAAGIDAVAFNLPWRFRVQQNVIDTAAGEGLRFISDAAVAPTDGFVGDQTQVFGEVETVDEPLVVQPRCS